VIDVLATEPHYIEHLRPVFDALPDDVRGAFTDNPDELHAASLVLVCSWKDYNQTGKRPVVFFEHGAGFTYNTTNRSYAGGPGRERAVLFANVNGIVDARNRETYPDAQHAIVGSPKLDALLKQPAPANDTPVVAFSWHWNCHVVPETRTALPHYRRALKTLAPRAGTWTPLGHSHPRAWHTNARLYRDLRWRTARTFTEVAQQSDVYVCDTSSTIYEYAALDRPVILLNAPWYRRDVHHGLRFWDYIPGIQVDHPDELPAAIDTALTGDTWSDARRAAVEHVYPHRGNATEVAAEAVLAVHG